MKKIGFGMIVIFVFIVLLNGYSVRASFANNKTNENEMKLIQSLITKRTEIMNKGLYNCKDIEHIVEELKAIEKGDILERDILSIKEASSNPTDYPMVSNTKIKNITHISINENIHEITAIIEWSISYDLEESIEEYEYIIQIEEQDEKYVLTEFRLTE